MAKFNVGPAIGGDAETIKELALINQMFESDGLGYFDEVPVGFLAGR